MGSMFVDCHHDEAASIIEMAAFQAQRDQFNTMAHPLDDESVFRNETDFEQDSCWPTCLNAVRSEEQWAVIELEVITLAKQPIS